MKKESVELDEATKLDLMKQLDGDFPNFKVGKIADVNKVAKFLEKKGFSNKGAMNAAIDFENYKKGSFKESVELDEAKMYTMSDFAKMVAKTTPKNADRYEQIAAIKKAIKMTNQKSLATDRDTIDEILDIMYDKHNFKESVELDEAKMTDADILKAAKSLAANGKDAKTKSFGQGLVDFYDENDSFTPAQVSGLQNIMKNASFQMAKESFELDEATVSIYKSLPASAGKTVSNKVQVKSFKDVNAKGAFLSKQTNNDWKDTGIEGLKSGKYRMNMIKGNDGKPAREFIKEDTTELKEGIKSIILDKMKK